MKKARFSQTGNKKFECLKTTTSRTVQFNEIDHFLESFSFNFSVKFLCPQVMLLHRHLNLMTAMFSPK